LINLEEFSKSLKDNFVIDESQKIALAVSGGADSMCLTLLAHKAGFNVICLIIDHGLRSTSNEEATKTKEFLNNNGIEAVIIKWLDYNPTFAMNNLHQKARDERYRLLITYCLNNNIKYLAIAHNKNDQAENVLIRISRGTGIDGLALMKDLQNRGGIFVIRPLLNYERIEIERTLQHFEWSWIDDPSNFSEKFTRTRIRELLKNNSDDLKLDRLVLLAKNATRAKSYLEEQTLEALTKNTFTKNLGAIGLNVVDFLLVHEEIQFRIISSILRQITVKNWSIRLTSLEALLGKIKNFENWHDCTFHGCELLKIKGKDALLFIREKNCIQELVIEKGKTDVVWDNRFSITLSDPSDKNITIKTLEKKHLAILRNQILIDERNIEHHKLKWIMPIMISDSEIIACPLLGWAGDKIKFNVRSIMS